jgi:hypothetical protein
VSTLWKVINCITYTLFFFVIEHSLSTNSKNLTRLLKDYIWISDQNKTPLISHYQHSTIHYNIRHWHCCKLKANIIKWKRKKKKPPQCRNNSHRHCCKLLNNIMKNKKYHIVETVLKSNAEKFVERSKIDTMQPFTFLAWYRHFNAKLWG